MTQTNKTKGSARALLTVMTHIKLELNMIHDRFDLGDIWDDTERQEMLAEKAVYEMLTKELEDAYNSL